MARRRRLHLYLRGTRPVCGADVSPDAMTEFWLDFIASPCPACHAALMERIEGIDE